MKGRYTLTKIETGSEVVCLQYDDSKIVTGHGKPEYTIQVGSCWCVVFLSSMEQSYVCAVNLRGGKECFGMTKTSSMAAVALMCTCIAYISVQFSVVGDDPHNHYCCHLVVAIAEKAFYTSYYPAIRFFHPLI